MGLIHTRSIQHFKNIANDISIMYTDTSCTSRIVAVEGKIKTLTLPTPIFQKK